MGAPDYDEQVRLMAFLHDAGWHDMQPAIDDLCDRLLRERVSAGKIVGLLEVLPFAEAQLAQPLRYVITAAGRFDDLDRDALRRLDLSPLGHDLLQRLLDQAVDDAAGRWSRFGIGPFESPGYLKDWLGLVTPIVMPDVLERMDWLLHVVCERLPPVPQDERFIVSDPVEDWLPGPASPVLLPVYQMVVQALGWRDKLEADNIDQWLCDARGWLGLQQADEDEVPDAAAEEEA